MTIGSLSISMEVFVLSISMAVIFLLMLILFIVLIVKQNKLKKRLDGFTQTREGESLETILKKVVEDNKKVKHQVKNDVYAISEFSKKMPMAYRKMGIVKYDAFPGMTGKISSSIALLNEEESGIIINSMHSKEGCFTYTKEIINGSAINPLTKEDEEALKIAKSKTVL